MTKDQRELLRAQAERRARAAQAYQQEDRRLREMLIMLDARFADPDSGVEFNVETMQVVEPTPTSDDAT